MKSCGETQAELSAYIDNELPSSVRATIEEHVRGCGACRQRLAELNELTAGVRALPQLHPAPGFLAAIRRKIANDTGSRTKTWQDYVFRPLWLKVPLEAVAVIVVVLFVVRLERPANKPLPSQNREAPAEQRADASVVAATEKLAPNRLVGSEINDRGAITPGNTIVVQGKNSDDVRQRLQELAVVLNGRILPSSNENTPAHEFLVELPAANLERFRTGLQTANLHGPSPQSTSLKDTDLAASSPRGDTASIVVHIRILPPAD